MIHLHKNLCKKVKSCFAFFFYFYIINYTMKDSGTQIHWIHCCSSFTKTSNLIELHRRFNHVVVEFASLEKFNLIQLEWKGFSRHSQSLREDFVVLYLRLSRPVYGVVQVEAPTPGVNSSNTHLSPSEIPGRARKRGLGCFYIFSASCCLFHATQAPLNFFPKWGGLPHSFFNKTDIRKHWN